MNILIDLTSPREQWRRLGHGYRVEAQIVLWEGDDRIVLPHSALFRAEGDAESWSVFVVEDGEARVRAVDRGRHNGLDAEILRGLAAGERVVLYPSDRVLEGARVVER